jgi:hypothetical protein
VKGSGLTAHDSVIPTSLGALWPSGIMNLLLTSDVIVRLARGVPDSSRGSQRQPLYDA